jgi:hypothetical protein
MSANPSLNAIAEALGVTRPRVSQMKARGMPTHSVKAALKWKAENVRPRIDHDSKGPGPAAAISYDLVEARAKREHHEARLAEMREAKEAGLLVERARVVKAAADAGAVLRQALERLGVQLAPQFAAERDELVIRTRIDAAVAEALADAEANLRRMAD